MVQQIYNNHMRFLGVIHYLLTYSLLQLTAYVALILAYYRQELPGVAVPFLAVFVLLNPITPFVAAYAIPCNLYLNVFMAAALALTAVTLTRGAAALALGTSTLAVRFRTEASCSHTRR